MGVHCKIAFVDNERGIFYGGQTLNGTVVLLTSEQKKFRGLRLTVEGVAKCKWTEKRGTGKNETAITFTGKDKYLSSVSYLFGSHSSDGIEIPAGVHTYSFEFDLPPLLPSSFEGHHSHIRYNVEAVLDIPWGFDKDFTLPFTVLKQEYLNQWPDLKFPIRMEVIKTFCCFPCQSRPLFLQVSIPYSGFTPGQIIPMTIEMRNKSNIMVERVKIVIKRLIENISDSPYEKSRFESDKMHEVYGPGVLGQESETILQSIEIPMILCNSNDHCSRIIKLTYELVLCFETGRCHMDPEIKIPIRIGSVPFIFQAPIHNAPSAPPLAQPSAPLLVPSNDNLDLPPSFEEATKNFNTNLEAGPEQDHKYGWNVVKATESAQSVE